MSRAPKATSKPNVPQPVVKGSKWTASNYVRPGLTQEEVIDIKTAFDLFDTDLGGSIDTKQLKAAMVSLGFQSKNNVIFQMVSDLDQDGNGTIEFDEFLQLMTNKISQKGTRAQFGKVFALYDDEKTGFISIKNLRRVASEIKETIGQQELQEMIDRADVIDVDGLVSQEEFYTILTRKVRD